MKTDISIYDFLALGPDAFRILTGGKQLEGAYAFRSETFKDIERRIDGLFSPVDHDGPVWLLEFQVEKRSTALYNLLTKIGLYGEQHPRQDVRGLLIVPCPSDHPRQPTTVGRPGDIIELIDLEDWLRELFEREPSNPYLAVLAPLIRTEPELRAQAPALWRTIQQAPLEQAHHERLSALLEYWFMERFRNLSLSEIRKMFQQLTPLQETRAYQEIFAEGEIEGKIESLTRLLSRRFGPLPTWAEQRISKANGDQLDAWFDALLDAKRLSDLLGQTDDANESH